MALPVYTYDSIPTDTEFNAFLRPTFVKDESEEEFPGQLKRLRDESLSNDPTQIKGRWGSFETALQVTAGSGLTANVRGGVVLLPSGLTLTVAPVSTAVPNNTTSIVFVNQSGAVAVAAVNLVPSMALRLAQVTTVSGAITLIVDLRPRYAIQPLASTIKVLGGNGGQGNFTLSGAQTFGDGLYYYNDFTITSTGVLTVSTFARIFCSGSVTLQGTINVTQAAGGAAAYNTGVPAAVNLGGLSGSGSGGGSGSAPGAGGAAYPYTAQPFGSGGGLGFASSIPGSGSVGFGAAGRGGGGLWIEAAGPILVTGAINAQGGNAGAGTIFSGAARVSGSGGGSGGLIYLSSLSSVTVPGSLNVGGGSGAAGLQQTDTGGAMGGGGGGGGYIVLVSPSNNTTGATLIMTGGAMGANAGGTGLGGGSGGGFGGAGGGQAAGSAGQFRSLLFIPGSG